MFTGSYAHLYNLFHAKKDYSHEVKQIVNALGQTDIQGLSGFDFGCGTGMHASEFLKLGAQVDGYDKSVDMLDVARANHPLIKFSADINDFTKLYDFTYSLFDVISYQITEDAALELILSLFERTKPGAYCLIDSWNSRGVQTDPPRVNQRTVFSQYGEVMRRVTPDLHNSSGDIYSLKIDLISTENKETLRTENHLLRAWSPQEVRQMMETVGFSKIQIYNPSDPEVQFQPGDWRFGARAIRP